MKLALLMCGGFMMAAALKPSVPTFLADKTIFSVTPDTVVEKFGPLADLRPEKPTQHTWQYIGANPTNGVAWVDVQFQPGKSGSSDEDKKRNWQFLQVDMGLDSTSFPFSQLVDDLSKRFRKEPEYTAGPKEHIVVWSLDPTREILVEEGTFQNPLTKKPEKVTHILAAVPQGEKD